MKSKKDVLESRLSELLVNFQSIINQVNENESILNEIQKETSEIRQQSLFQNQPIESKNAIENTTEKSETKFLTNQPKSSSSLLKNVQIVQKSDKFNNRSQESWNEEQLKNELRILNFKLKKENETISKKKTLVKEINQKLVQIDEKTNKLKIENANFIQSKFNRASLNPRLEEFKSENSHFLSILEQMTFWIKTNQEKVPRSTSNDEIRKFYAKREKQMGVLIFDRSLSEIYRPNKQMVDHQLFYIDELKKNIEAKNKF